jgi:hypothetical protein
MKIDHAAAATSDATRIATNSTIYSDLSYSAISSALGAVYQATESALEPLIFNPTLPACYQAAKIEKTT